MLASCSKSPQIEKSIEPVIALKIEQTNKSDNNSPQKIIEREKGFRIIKNSNLPKTSQTHMFKIVRKIYEVHLALPESEQQNIIDPEELKKQAEFEKMFGLRKAEEPRTVKNIDYNNLTQ